jgi:hypothetical protein
MIAPQALLSEPSWNFMTPTPKAKQIRLKQFESAPDRRTASAANHARVTAGKVNKRTVDEL